MAMSLKERRGPRVMPALSVPLKAVLPLTRHTETYIPTTRSHSDLLLESNRCLQLYNVNI